MIVSTIAIQTFMILYPPVAELSRPHIAELGLPLCFQPDGGVSDSSSESDEEADVNSIPPRPLVPELQRDSLYRWFEMRATCSDTRRGSRPSATRASFSPWRGTRSE